ncbi:MAG: hypothetical protein ACRD3O_18120, partial [Terriglobia bacterium]
LTPLITRGRPCLRVLARMLPKLSEPDVPAENSEVLRIRHSTLVQVQPIERFVLVTGLQSFLAWRPGQLRLVMERRL